MAFDGLLMKAMEQELVETIESGRVTKIYQPFKNELLFQIRAKGKNVRLFISSHPSYARIHLTKETFENPSEPPMFCMLLRKHLDGSFIEKIEQLDLDRILIIHFQSRNEIGDTTYKKLIVEIMGRHSNIILVDADTNLIIDSTKHIPHALSRHRTILPGHTYIDPPPQGKLNPLEISEDEFLMKLDFNGGKLDQQMVDQFAGLSPLVSKEILALAGLPNRVSLSKSFFKMMEYIKNRNYLPTIIETESKEIFHVLPLTHIQGEKKSYASASEMLDRFFYGKAERDRVKQQANDVEKLIKNEYNKNEKKIQKLEKQLQDAKKAETFQLHGELLTANLFAVKKGDKKVDVTNYYDEDGEVITITLDPRKTPSENAQHLFQKYQKLKNSVEIVKEQIEIAKEEMIYFDTLAQQMESASPKDIEEIRTELAEEGYIKKKKSNKKKPSKVQKPQVDEYISSDGTLIVVGKNNKQNEYVTNKLGRSNEIWLHTKDIPGSHVVIRSEKPTEQTLMEAATIAAYFSKARNSSKVPVDYTLIKHVKKPNGAKPGYVIYENQTTLFVTPNEDTVRALRKN